MSVVPSGTVWQPSRDFGVIPGASSSSSNSASVASLQDSRPSFTMTWHVEQAQTPPQAWSRPILKPSEMSRMLPGRPLWPYGSFSGSTSIVLPLGRNVTLYFFVAGLYLTSSMYGLVPPMIYSPKRWRYKAAATIRGAQSATTDHAAIYDSRHRLATRSGQVSPVLLITFRPRRACGLRGPLKPPNSSTIPQGARSRDSARRCACG